MAPPAFLAFHNGEFVPAAHVGLGLADQGLLWGAIAVERLRTYRHRPFLAEQHLERFAASAAAMAIELPHSPEVLVAKVEELLARNRALLLDREEYFVVLLATPGFPRHPPTLMIHLEVLDRERSGRRPVEGFILRSASTQALPPECVPARIKHRSRLHWWLAEQEVRRVQPNAVAVLRDGSGHFTETSFANIVWRIGSELRSPPPAAILPGITLGVVRELASALGMAWREGAITQGDVQAAEECFLTGTAFGIAAVRSIDGKSYPHNGPAVVQLTKAWCERYGFAPA